MEIQKATISTRSDEILELGTWLGRKQAFAELAGRCSAADAECLRRVRNGKMYRTLKLSWRQFCKQRLGISGSTADLTIQRLEEFGPAFFMLAQATGITAEEFRRVSGSVRGQALLHAGEEIPINAENAPRLTVAIEELRRGPGADDGAGENAGMGDALSPAEAKAQAEIKRHFERALRAAKVAREHFQSLVEMHLEGRGRMELMAQLGQLASQFKQLEQATWK